MLQPVSPIRKAEIMLDALDRICYLHHGATKEIKGEQEFENGVLRVLMKQRGFEIVPVPSQRHNKTGIVEKKTEPSKIYSRSLNRTSDFQECISRNY